MEFKHFVGFLSFLPFLTIIQLKINVSSGKVRVKIYDHRAYHDPIHWYGKGPWKYFGHGYGIDYGYDHDSKQSHEKGYGFVKAFAREFCKNGFGCKPPDPEFWKTTSLSTNGFSAEPYFARPPADVMEPRVPQSVPDSNFVADHSNHINLNVYSQANEHIGPLVLPLKSIQSI